MQVDKYGVPAMDPTDNVSPLEGLINPMFQALGDGIAAGGVSHVDNSQTSRDNFFGTPSTSADQLALQNSGATSIRTDLGVTQQYFAAYNATTNPGGRATAGWYSTLDSGWTSWTPALQATSFAHSGETVSGLYTRIGNTVIGHALLSYPSVSNSGSGAYTVTFPVPVVASDATRSIGRLSAALAGASLGGSTTINGNPLYGNGSVPITFSGTYWSNGTPMGALSGLGIRYEFAYQAA